MRIVSASQSNEWIVATLFAWPRHPVHNAHGCARHAERREKYIRSAKSEHLNIVFKLNSAKCNAVYRRLVKCSLCGRFRTTTTHRSRQRWLRRRRQSLHKLDLCYNMAARVASSSKSHYDLRFWYATHINANFVSILFCPFHLLFSLCDSRLTDKLHILLCLLSPCANSINYQFCRIRRGYQSIYASIMV